MKGGCGSWECACNDRHSIPFVAKGKSGSVRVVLIPAPKGIGLCIGDEAKKLMRLAGVRDIWSKTFGDSRSRINYMYAVFDAFRQMNASKIEYEDLTEIRVPRKRQEEPVQQEQEQAIEQGSEQQTTETVNTADDVSSPVSEVVEK